MNLTGNPFVDIGSWALAALAGVKQPKELAKDDLKIEAEDIASLYNEDEWRKSLYSIFPNNPITNNAVKKKKKRYLDFLNELIDNISPLKNSGSCIGCGQRDFEYQLFKDKVPLTGSGNLVNYFSYGSAGAHYCPACTFAIQFSPLAMYACGRKKLFLHSNSVDVMRYWIKEPIHNVRQQLLSKNFNGCYDNGIKNPINSLFDVIGNIQDYQDVQWETKKPSIQFYHFTNWNQGPELNRYQLPTSVFRFLACARIHAKYPEWRTIVKRGYQNVDWEKIESKEDYINRNNTVYQRLLRNEPITRFFIDLKHKKAYGDWSLLSLYLSEVKKMGKSRIETVKEVGDRIAKYIKSTADVNRLSKFERVDGYREFRNQLRLIIKGRIRHGEDEELFTLDEYMESLVPDYRAWRETQDLLLFRIYERLHDWLVQEKYAEDVSETLEQKEVVER